MQKSANLHGIMKLYALRSADLHMMSKSNEKTNSTSRAKICQLAPRGQHMCLYSVKILVIIWVEIIFRVTGWDLARPKIDFSILCQQSGILEPALCWGIIFPWFYFDLFPDIALRDWIKSWDVDGFLFLHRNGKSLTGVLPFNHCTPCEKLVGLLKCLETLLVTEKL